MKIKMSAHAFITQIPAKWLIVEGSQSDHVYEGIMKEPKLQQNVLKSPLT